MPHNLYRNSSSPLTETFEALPPAFVGAGVTPAPGRGAGITHLHITLHPVGVISLTFDCHWYENGPDSSHIVLPAKAGT